MRGTGARDISTFTAAPYKVLGQNNQVQFQSVSSGAGLFRACLEEDHLIRMPYRCPRMERACPLVETW